MTTVRVERGKVLPDEVDDQLMRTPRLWTQTLPFVSLTTVRRPTHLQILEDWERLWSALKVGRALRAVDRLPPRLQLRADFSFLNATRVRSGFIASDACNACGAPFDTRAHYLAFPAWDRLRPPLFRASMAAGSFFGSLYLPTLLNDTLLKSLAKFIEATGRFADL
ncbi:hypothetical protein C8J57DRAFT_1737139 [Mycena rebaudengoi]|nr:hypothetical protein C8J57DRAFT_1737139 [Mycena rebaudengoi]